jgi:frataxin-like iron-binding protein CyaY
MIGFICRNIVKKVRIPPGNLKHNVRITVPQKQFLESIEFSRLSQEYLYRTKKCLEDIKSSNPDSKLEVQHSSIKFENKDFTLVLERNFKEQSLSVLIGDGIAHSYFYDVNTERWICITDGHLLEELLCREVTRKCQGYFNI